MHINLKGFDDGDEHNKREGKKRDEKAQAHILDKWFNIPIIAHLRQNKRAKLFKLFLVFKFSSLEYFGQITLYMDKGLQYIPFF